MGPRSRDDNKDTDEQLEAIRDDVEELRRNRTPPIGAMVTREESREIAEDVHAKSRPEREQGCWRDGPAHQLQQEINDMNRRVSTVESSVSQMGMERQRDKDEREREGKARATRLTVWGLVITVVLGTLTLLNGSWSRAASAEATQVNSAVLQQLREVAARLDARKAQP